MQSKASYSYIDIHIYQEKISFYAVCQINLQLLHVSGDELDSCCYNGTSNESRLSVGKSVVEEQDSTKSQNDSRSLKKLTN